MGDRRLTLVVIGLVVLGGAALVLDWIAQDPARHAPPSQTPAPAPMPVSDRDGDAPELPSAGAVRVESTRAGLTIRSNGAPRSAVLGALGRAGGFVVTGATRDDPPLRLVLQVGDLRTAVVAILGDAPHQLEHATSADGEKTLTRVVLIADPLAAASPGEARPGDRFASDGDVASTGTGAEPAGSELAPDPNRLRRRTPSEIDATRRKRERLLEDQRREDLAVLEDGTDEGRASAVSRLDADDHESFVALSKSMSDDPSSRVRMNAAQRLGFGQGSEVVPVLTAGLGDPDPDVVVEVVEALAFVGEPDAISALEALGDHESPAVRKAASDAIEVLR